MATKTLEKKAKVVVFTNPRYHDPVWLAADKKRFDTLLAYLDYRGMPEDRHPVRQRYESARYEFLEVDAKYP